MQTELLNQFIFADLLGKHAQRIFNQHNESNPEQKVTPDEIKKEAFEHLNWLRLESLKLLHNSEVDINDFKDII